MKKYYPQLLVSLSLLASPLVMANNCVQIQEQAKKAYEQHNLSSLQQAQNKMRGSACPAKRKAYVERQLAYLMYDNFVSKRVQGQVLVNAMNSIIRQNDSFWPALVALADYYHDSKNFNQSTKYYTLAIDSINNETKTLEADVPQAREIKRIRERAELDLLASTAVATLRGDGDGILTTNIRGSRAFKKRLPIHFDSGSDRLVGPDLRYARRLLRSLRKSKRGDSNITIIGHTDPTGRQGMSPQAIRKMNKKLSIKRAIAVGKYLTDHGYKGRVVTKGKGQDEPIYDPRNNAKRHYGARVWNRMLRRVEVFIKN